jgi:hypothetical protein
LARVRTPCNHYDLYVGLHACRGAAILRARKVHIAPLAKSGAAQVFGSDRRSRSVPFWLRDPQGRSLPTFCQEATTAMSAVLLPLCYPPKRSRSLRSADVGLMW